MRSFGSVSIVTALLISALGFSGCFTKAEICSKGGQMKQDMAVLRDAIFDEHHDVKYEIHSLCSNANFKDQLWKDAIFTTQASEHDAGLKAFNEWVVSTYTHFEVLCSMDRAGWPIELSSGLVQQEMRVTLGAMVIPMGEILLKIYGCQ